MPKARRRTLNHCDIDHFLSEIAAVADPKPQKSVDDVAATFLLPIEEPKQKDEASLIRDYCKVSSEYTLAQLEVSDYIP